ncbi:hypothetical protein OPV22_031620 [Ensete ventricosum]|uniref:phosphoglycerate mutase (2,3-diphosphoglycerate-independent) n=1 Tax=Ensete ventricosum TaxID=4639 RepID=A0AAV8PJH1_ENSVE|nr:hypothetical protein OPV22_031620 [Ensete ventricosum]
MGSPEFSWKLADHPRLPKGKTVVVVVLDGLGDANPDQYNCIHVADTLAMDSLKKKGIDAQIASGGGQMYVTMDRYENDCGIVKREWDAQVLGEAPYKFRSALEAIKKLREDPKANDQHLPPFAIVEDGKAVGPTVNGDAVVTFNFRADRMAMIAKALECENFDEFDWVLYPKIRYAGMLRYDGELKLPSHCLVSPPNIERTSGEYLVHNGIKTFACSEAVKFGHVTFFRNGNWSGYRDPSMEEARDAILSGKFHQVCINLANGDMIGHTVDISRLPLWHVRQLMKLLRTIMP